jgi:hypothetical protein
MWRPARVLLLALSVLALAPSGAGAQTFNFFSTDGLGPSQGAGTHGPATRYPSTIEVAGLAGGLEKVTLTVLHLVSGSPDDIDMLLVGPEGDQVMLMSDACGATQSIDNDIWTFDDDAPAALADEGPCASDQAAAYKPSNYVGGAPEPDQFGAGGGIGPPYSNALATFAGTDPDGPWDLYLFDDREAVVGFELGGWMLTLEIESPSSPPPSLPAPQPVLVAPAPVPSPAQVAPAARTGRRAAAFAKCKAKKTKKARKRCRVRARRLPR